MTPAEALALGRRALAAGFVPADGALMLVRSYHRAHVEDGPDLFWWSGPWGERCDCGNVPSGERYRSDQDTEGDREVLGPDFRDAATLGVLEAQVRARIGEEAIAHAWTEEGDDLDAPPVVRWGIHKDGGDVYRFHAHNRGSFPPIAVGPDRASAWVAALEARP